MGPLEFTVMGFESQHCSAEVLRELEVAHEHQIVRVIDILFVSKSDTGVVEVRELSDLPEEDLVILRTFFDPGSERQGWFALDDVDVVAEQLPLATSAIIVLVEHVWATRLRSAVMEAGGFVLIDGRIPSAIVDEVVDAVAAQGS
jgi:Family of unknown function (DUF6325)